MPNYRRSHAPGATYFFTVTLAQRPRQLLVEHIDVLRRAYGAVQRKSPFQTNAICILPDHLHASWTLPDGDAAFSSRWSWIKNGFSRALPTSETRSDSKFAKREKGLWQRRFWEHQIRDEEDMQRHVDYIHYNPVRHGWVAQAVDWPYSSFHHYLRRGWLAPDWGGVTGEPDAAGE